MPDLLPLRLQGRKTSFSELVFRMFSLSSWPRHESEISNPDQVIKQRFRILEGGFYSAQLEFTIRIHLPPTSCRMGCVCMSAQALSESATYETKRSCIFWGKFSQEGPRCLPLAAHCLDVGMVFRALCDVDGIRRALSRSCGEGLSEQQLDRLAVLAMIHDLGKANLGFQLKVFDVKAPQAGHIRELAPLLDLDICDENLHMAFVEAISRDLFSWFSDPEVAYGYLMATFSHHGRPLAFQGQRSGSFFKAQNEWWRPQGQWDPMAAVTEVMRWAREAFLRPLNPVGVFCLMSLVFSIVLPVWLCLLTGWDRTHTGFPSIGCRWSSG